MNRFTFSRRRAERFAQLLDEANGGRRHHVRSRGDDDLAGLVAIGQRIQATAPTAAPDPDFRTSLRAMLVATAVREGIGATAPEAVPTPPAPTTSTRSLFPGAITGQRARARGAILIGVAAGAIAVSGISAASENAVPGDALYGMKRSTERAQLALASSDLSRGQLLLDFARTRLVEAEALRSDPTGFTAVLNDMDADTRQGVRLLTSSAVQRTDSAALDAINTFLTGQRRAVTRLLDGGSRAQREQVGTSLALLDAAGRRSETLRAALVCRAPRPVRTDSLGPQPQSCPPSRPTASQPSLPSTTEPRSPERQPAPTRTTGQPQPPAVIGSMLPTQNAPDAGKPNVGRPAG